MMRKVKIPFTHAKGGGIVMKVWNAQTTVPIRQSASTTQIISIKAGMAANMVMAVFPRKDGDVG